VVWGVQVSGRTKVILGVAVVAVLAIGAGILYLLFGQDDGPAKLTFGDATTTTAKGATTSSAPAAPAGIEGAWVATDRSQAGYRVLEDRLGGAANVEAVGRTNQVTGGFTVAASGAGAAVSDVSFTVDVASIASNSGMRDGRFRSSIMNADQFPTATFTADPITLTSVPAADGSTVEVPVTGKLTLRGQTRDVTTKLQVKRTATEVQVLGSIPVKFSDYGIDTPSPPGLSVRDNGSVEFLVVAVPR
jgi:polyisoprenoid-binding protein YceI